MPMTYPYRRDDQPPVPLGETALVPIGPFGMAKLPPVASRAKMNTPGTIVLVCRTGYILIIRRTLNKRSWLVTAGMTCQGWPLPRARLVPVTLYPSYHI
jgi:hypothetical protein